jgi:hypothetical protein
LHLPQSKTGYLWGKEVVGSSSVSATLQFRISGQGKNFFGDGLALWLNDWNQYKPVPLPVPLSLSLPLVLFPLLSATNNTLFTVILMPLLYFKGQLHGGSDAFKGIAIIIDTFVNTESKNLHKDIAVLVNDGSKNTDDMVAVQVHPLFISPLGIIDIEQQVTKAIAIDGICRLVARPKLGIGKDETTSASLRLQASSSPLMVLFVHVVSPTRQTHRRCAMNSFVALSSALYPYPSNRRK